MLDGTFQWTGQTGDKLLDSVEMKVFLQALRRPVSVKTKATIPDIDPVISVEDYKSIFNKTKEETASHPPLHYGHFKVAVESDPLLQVNLLFMNLPFMFGIPLSRWLQSLHCMIQKDAEPKITRLRIVQLYEADFNSVLKFVLGRKLMHHADDHGINSPQLYGSRKNKSTHEALITLRVIYDMARLERCHMVSLFNDLKGCYDRIRPALNTITTRRMGCPAEMAVCHARTVRLMKHRVRTAAGLSVDSITWSKEVDPGGVGQGNGAGPQSYHGQLLPQVLAYEQIANQGVAFVNPQGTKTFYQWLIGYVDDNSILLMVRDETFAVNMMDKLLTEARRCVDIWQKLVVIAGGEIEVRKSCIAIMTWILKGGTEQMATSEEAPGTFQLQSLSNPDIKKELKRLDTNDGERILGVRLALSGSDKDEYIFRQQQANELAATIASSPFTRLDAETIYR